MSILKNDLILASDVVEYQYYYDLASEVTVWETLFSGVDSKTRTYTKPLPPAHKFELSWGRWDDNLGDITTKIYTIDCDDYDATIDAAEDSGYMDSWDLLGTYTDEIETTIKNETREPKYIRIYVKAVVPGGSSNSTHFQPRFRIYITEDIAVAGMPVRILSSALTEWLDSGTTELTTAVYYDGRVGYYIEDDDTTDYADRYLWSGAVQDLKTLESALEVLDAAYETDPSDENLALVTAKQAEIDAQEIVVQDYVDAIELAEEE